MALHRTDGVGEGVDPFTDIYALPISDRTLPKFRIPEHRNPPRAVRTLIQDELALEANAAQNFATFCTTWVEPEVRELMDACIGKNLMDRDAYPRTAEIESRCLRILADLWNAPEGGAAVGCSTTGSSEAAMLAGIAMKSRRRSSDRPTDRPNLVCGPVHVCWEKFARYFDVELRRVPLEPEATGLRPHQLRRHVDENTIGVVAILGVTFTGHYEPVAELSAELDAIQAETGIDVPLHVDAASGGFIAPFLQPELVWDFRLPRVASINTSGHKYGMAPLSVGWVLWRSPELLPEDLVFEIDYLGGATPTFGLSFSRPAGEVVAQYYNLLRLGRQGYKAIHETTAHSARFLAARIAEMGPFRVLHDGHDALPAVAWTLDDPGSAGFSLYDLSERLRLRGWQVPAYPLPPDRQETVTQRVLVRHGTSHDKVAMLADDVRAAVAHLGRRSRSARTEPGFHH
ncbi:glutamate decarboxylase [Streptomyces sp. ZYX-F-203]